MDPFQLLCMRVGELLANVGLIRAAVMSSDSYPQEVKDSIDQKTEQLAEDLERAIGEFQDFGEFYDEEDR